MENKIELLTKINPVKNNCQENTESLLGERQFHAKPLSTLRESN
jgi:hypothetical protein